jgi:GT2 family glycosyltransferase
MKIAVFLLFRPREHELTKNILYLLQDENKKYNIRFFLFCNGIIEEDSRKYYEQLFNCDIVVSRVNIGVAPARNVLIDRSMRWGADLFVSVDNDLMLPLQYIEKLIHSYNFLKKKTKKLGVIAPVIVDYRRFYDSGFLKEDIDRWETIELLEKQKDIYYHLGVREWAGVYLYSPLYRKMRKKFCWLKRMGTMANSIGIWIAGSSIERKKLFRDPHSYFEVDTLPGGVHVFDREFRNSVGRFDERFAPFGNEDSEFCIRALTQNYQSYLLKDICVIHDIDDRLRQRSSFYVKMLGGRARRLLVDLYVGNFFEKILCYFDCVFLMSYHVAKYDGPCFNIRMTNTYWHLYGFIFKPLISENEFSHMRETSKMIL